MGKGRFGPENPNWRGGRSVTSHGYVLIRVGKDHPLADVRGYAYEHRLVAEKKLGRPLKPKEEVHHEEATDNNDPSKIQVMPSRAHHRALHRKRTDLRPVGSDNPLLNCECGCGAPFLKYDPTNRPRRFISGHNFRKN